MTLDKAIKKLNSLFVDLEHWKDPERDQALQIGIEAIRRELDNRSGSKYVIVAPLQGETEE